MSPFIEIALRALITIVSIIVLTRLHGLRSFSKMSGFDFAITVAVGSVLAGAITTLSTPIWHFLIALIALFGVQIVMSQARARHDRVSDLLDNGPLLIMENGQPIPENLAKGGMTHADLWAKLREANAYELRKVHAVVLENTGDVSVLHGDGDKRRVSDEVLQGVRRS